MLKNLISLGIGIGILLLMVASSVVDASSKTANLTEEYAFPKMKLSEWPHKHVFVQAGSGMKVLGNNGLGNSNQPLPLGVPFDVETPLFKGKILLRFRNAKSDDPTSHSKYFNNGASSNKRLMQTVVQGRFKKPMKMSDVYVGSTFPQPLAGAPPPTMSKIMDAVIGKVAPGVVMDLSSQTPKVIALLAGTAATMSINERGSEPDITLPEIEEDVTNVLGNSAGTTAAKRRKVLGNPKKAASFHYNTEHVYTFHTYDESMDYGRGTMVLPLYGEYDIKPAIGNQPLSLTGIAEPGGEILYDLRIWHETHASD